MSTRYALALRSIVKTFGGVRALDGATLEVEAGAIHGIVGQNGAGKSTLIRILAGLHEPDAGDIVVGNATHRSLTPHQAHALGIHFIHQDRLLVPSFTVGEALLLGQEILLHRRLPILNRRAMQRKAAEILHTYFGLSLPPNALIGDLTTAQRQIVQITRALLHGPKILVFDEPTAALVKREADILFALIRRLSREGITILYISHYLAEIEALCDRVTVLRNGLDVATVDPRATPAAEIATLMIARDVGAMFPKRAVPIGAPILAVDGLGRRGAFADVSLKVHRGEIVGLTGLLGSGTKEVVRALFGLDRADTGTITMENGRFAGTSPAAAVARRIGLVPEDRRGEGVALALSVAENTTLASLGRFSSWGFLRRADERAEVDRLLQRLAVKAAGREASVRTLSGGNQQKVVLAKWLCRQSTLYVLDEPTVGVDVGAKIEIYGLIGDLVERGAGILLVSTDLAELVGVADRILVMFRGRIVRDYVAASTSPDEILAEATGSRELPHVG